VAGDFRCIVQGCKGPVGVEGDVCGDCRAAFEGFMTYNPDGRRRSAEEIAISDAALRRAYEQQIGVEMVAAQRLGPERRANQVCWMCAERRTCTRMERGWECASCVLIQ